MNKQSEEIQEMVNDTEQVARKIFKVFKKNEVHPALALAAIFPVTIGVLETLSKMPSTSKEKLDEVLVAYETASTAIVAALRSQNGLDTPTIH